MKCYLHIGTEKTATTTLQNFLHLNRGLLSSFGITYTKSMGLTNNWMLPVAAYDLDRRDNFTEENCLASNEALENYQHGIICELADELQRVSQPVVVFSSEHIHSRLTNIDEIQRLKDILVSFGVEEFSVVLYLRNPAELVNSLYSTAVKYGSAVGCPPPPENEYYQHICNHKNSIKNFVAVFGPEALKPRIFEDRELKNGSIIEDFLRLIGAPWTEEYLLPDNSNEGMSALGLALLNRFNKQVSGRVNTNHEIVRDDIIKFFETNFIGDKYSMPRKLYQEYDKAFADSNEWVRKNWFPEKEYLFSKKRYPGEVDLQLTNEELDKLAAMFANTLIKK